MTESERVVPVSGVSEITLEQGDLAAAEKFYSEVLGFPVVERWADETVWVMAGDRTRIGLWRPQIGLGGGRGGVHVHYAMGLPAESYDVVVERLRKHGYTVLARPRRVWASGSRAGGVRHRPRRPRGRVLDVGRRRAPSRARRGRVAGLALSGDKSYRRPLRSLLQLPGRAGRRSANRGSVSLVGLGTLRGVQI